MNGDGDQGTDGASIKPVSSLRSIFEGLNVRRPSQDEAASPREPPRHQNPPGRTEISTVRASFDVPRPDSPWGGLKDSGTTTPRTPGPPARRAESPPKSNHRRPMSMIFPSSPQLTPSVTIESPKSPPKGYFFNRSGSRSPERLIDSTPFSKVRELISQHSSRDSTRPGTPQPEISELSNVSTTVDTTANPVPASTENAPKSPLLPPQFKRPEKPKIPAKPNTFTGQDLTGLVTKTRKASIDARVSPFSTPPSSDEEGAPERTLGEKPSRHNPIETMHLQPGPRKASLQHEKPLPVSSPVTRINESGQTALTKSSHISERRDPRIQGFSFASPRPPSRGNSASPTRSNTVSEPHPTRDARDFGLQASKPTPRHVSETIRHMPPPMTAVQPISSHQAPVRDARQFGFSTHIESPQTELRPGLPPRRIGTEQPRRPSADSKRPATKPPKEPSVSLAVDRSTKPGAKPTNLAHDSQTSETLSTTPYFPPPPKRNTIKETELQSLDTSRSGIIPVTRGSSILDTSRISQDTARFSQGTTMVDDSDETEEFLDEPSISRAEYPDMSQINRRQPFFDYGLQELPAKSDIRTFDVCGQYLCTAGYVTKVFDFSSGEPIMSLNHGETVKVLSVGFKPAATLEGEGTRIWIGNNIGELHEIDIATHSTVASSLSHNKCEIIRILRYRKDLWTLDDEGKLFVWPADESGTPSLKYSHLTHRVQRGHTYSLLVNGKLWLATGKEIRIYKPGDEANFAPLTKPLAQPGTGDITSGTFTAQNGGQAIFGHNDGKVTIYSTRDFTCLGNIKASDYKINGLAFVGDWLWAAYKTGKIYVYDTSVTPWKVKKGWTAHDGPATGILLDPSSVWTFGKLQVTSVGQDNVIRLWDGMLEDDWVENAVQESDIDYCTFREIKAAVVTWNVGAINPSGIPADFIEEAIQANDPPELLAFGFQEVVDLEDRAVTAKSLLGFGKKKDTVSTEQHQSRIYREWRDELSKCVNRYAGAGCSYSELHTSSLIGLFQCVFVRQEERQNIRSLCGTDVKCGMKIRSKSRYGNKGALITRFVLDDSSLCFINCHLAAGQTHTSHRNKDVKDILDAENLPREPNLDMCSSLFVGGGDGSQILDHEICILNGDLNYRIDTIPRDAVIGMIKRNELAKLLERDQIMVSRRRGRAFPLSPFTELPITFAPTYKYDVGTDNYDSSEKKRAPAWCDRLLYRGPGRIKQTEYRRHEVRASDHRPVSGIFKIRIKTIDETKRLRTKERCTRAFDDVKRRLKLEANVAYLVNSLGVGEKEARDRLLKK